jgi:hypothetical protein
MTTYATLTMSDGRVIRIPEQFPITVRKLTWNDFDMLTLANVSIVKQVLYGRQRMINDAGGQGTREVQQKRARDKYRDYQLGRVRTDKTREPKDALLKMAISLAIEHEVRATFMQQKRKLIAKDIEAAAKLLVATNPKWNKVATQRLAALAAQKEADARALRDADSDVQDAMDSLMIEHHDGENSEEDIVDAAEAAE